MASDHKISRKALLQATGLAGIVVPVVLLRKYRSEVHDKIADFGAEDYQLISDKVVVPSDFLGLHFHRWPEGQPLSPAPTFDFGSVRSHDYPVPWHAIEPAQGKRNWDKLDKWVDTFHALKKTLLYTVYGTPTWAATDRSTKDPYGYPGAGSPPKDMHILESFVRALVSRYNGGSEKKIKFIEIWNEPMFRNRSTDFWWSGPEDLVQLAQAVFDGAKSADRGITVLSPGFTGVSDFDSNPPKEKNPIYQFLTTSSGSGKKGKDLCEAIAVHYYDEMPGLKPTRGIEGCINSVKRLLTDLELSFPIYTTELGFENPKKPFLNATLAEQAAFLKRTAAIQAAMGVQAVYFYSYDDGLDGNPSIHPEIAAAFQEIETKIAGQTLIQVTQVKDGTVRVQTSRETFHW